MLHHRKVFLLFHRLGDAWESLSQTTKEIQKRLTLLRLDAIGSSPEGHDTDFPDGPAVGITNFLWSKIPATSGHHTLCWCLASPGGCTKREDFMHEVGKLEVKGPNDGHTFKCSWSKPCVVNPIHGTNLFDGQRLLYTSREACRVDNGTTLSKPDIYSTWSYDARRATTPAEASLSNQTEMGVIAKVSSQCKDFYVGCSHVWSGDQMGARFAVPYLAGGYRLCWCHSNNCTTSDYNVEIGTLMVEDHPPLPWTLKTQPIMSPPDLGAPMR